jgi:hypothetical protein
VFRTGDAVLAWLAADKVQQALQVAEDTLRDYPADYFTSQHRHHLVATVESHLYNGDAEQAWTRLERAWPSLRWSGFLLLECLGTQLRYLRACAALAMARSSSSRTSSPFLGIARREARRIRRSALPMAAPMAHAIDGGIAGAERRRDAQIVSLLAAADGFDAAGMALHREAARWHLGGVMRGEKANREASGLWMTRQGIVRPASMAQAVVPPV